MPPDIDALTMLPDPYPIHDGLIGAGVQLLSDGRWVVASADGVEAVLADAAAVIGFDVPAISSFTTSDTTSLVQSRMARFSDGEPHADRRRMATGRLDAIDASALRTRAFDITAALLEHHGTVDLIATVARYVPIAVLSSALADPNGPVSGAAHESVLRLAQAIAPQRGRPRGDAESAVRRIAEVIERETATAGSASTAPLSDTVINTAALLFQTVDATAGLIGNSVVTASRSGAPSSGAPDVAAFVAEVSRFDPAVHFTTRRAVAPVVVLDREIPAGSTVVVDLAAAGRDPSRFAEPDRFRPERNGPSFAFGDGVHRCPGRDHALALATGVFAAIVAGGGHLLATDEPPITYEDRFNLRVPKSLHWSV